MPTVSVWRSQVDPQLGYCKRPSAVGAKALEEVVDHVLLASLAEREAAYGECVAQCIEAVQFAAEWQCEDVSFDGGSVLQRIDPERDEVGVGGSRSAVARSNAAAHGSATLLANAPSLCRIATF